MLGKSVLSVNLRVGTKDIGEAGRPKWLAFEEQTGLFAFADGEKAAVSRLAETVGLALDLISAEGGRANVDEYLDSHGVQYSEVLMTEEAVLNVVPADEPELAYAAG